MRDVQIMYIFAEATNDAKLSTVFFILELLITRYD